MNGFKLKVSSTFGGMVFLIIVALISISFILFKAESIQLNKQVLFEKNATVKADIDTQIEGYLGALSGISVSASDVIADRLSENAIIQLQALSRAQSKIIEGAYIVDKDGVIYDAQGNKRPVNAKELKRTYYQAIFEQGQESFLSDPFDSVITTSKVVAMAHKINDEFLVITTVYLEPLLANAKDRQDIFVFTEEGNILVAPSVDLVWQNIFDVYPEYRHFSTQTPELQYDTQIDGNQLHFNGFWGSLDHASWKFVSFIKTSEIEAGANKQLWLSAILGFAFLVGAVIALILLLEKLVLNPVGGPPEHIAFLMEKMAQGEFPKNVQVSGNESGIYLSFLKLAQQLSTLIHNSYQISESVSAASAQLNIIMSNTKQNAQVELSQMSKVDQSIHTLSEASQGVREQARQAEEQAELANSNVKLGEEQLNLNSQLTQNVSVSINESAQIVDELQKFATDIGSVTEVINSISEQTNLLALNAAIEAARAGEHGRGFAVVADEVRSLAYKTQESTVTIQTTIEKLQAQSVKAQANMSHNVALIEESVSVLDSVNTVFNDIHLAVQSISNINTQVANASQEQVKLTDQISLITTETHALVEKNVSGVEETLQATSNLSRLADEQKSELSYFKI